MSVDKIGFSVDGPQLLLRCSVLLRKLQAALGLGPHFILRLALAHTMASISELTCIYWAFILHDDEVTVMEDKINALIIAASVNVEPFWPGLFAKALALGASSAI